MDNIEILKEQIRTIFPQMEEEKITELADSYIIETLLERAKTITEEQMRREIAENI